MKILLIEDSKALSKALIIGLENNGYLVETTDDGLFALELIRNEEYELIILDLMIKSLDGMSVLKKIRKENNETPVLIISAKVELSDKTTGLFSGADDYLCKPFEFDELLARITAIIRRSNNIQKTEISINNQSIYLDLSLKKFFANDNEIHFTAKEFSLLELLFLKQGTVLSYDSIMNQLYSVDNIVTNNTIETHISNIRKKLKKYNIENLLQTKRGIGFYIEK